MVIPVTPLPLLEHWQCKGMFPKRRRNTRDQKGVNGDRYIMHFAGICKAMPFASTALVSRHGFIVRLIVSVSTDSGL